jgi:hypothetical protein
MRHFSPALGVGAILLLSGCADSKWSIFRHSQDTARLPAERPLAAAEVVAYLNNNAQQIQSLTCSNVDLDCKQGYQEFHIRGKLACQKPKNFRMQAEALGRTEADIGSNDQEFWYWIARGEPYLIHCSYQDLAGGVRIPFPFQPQWVMEALGMAEYDPTQPYQLVAQRGTFQLTLNTKNSQGQPVRRITEFKQLAGRIQVTDHILQSPSGSEICRAHITEPQEIRRGVIIPRKIVFSYPAEQLKLSMTLWQRADDVILDQQFNQAQGLFARPALAGVQDYDLGRGPAGASQLSPAGGILQR